MSQNYPDLSKKMKIQGAPKPEEPAKPAAAPPVYISPDGKKMRYKGTGDYDDPKNWEAVQ
jgi:hypothetical protein